MGDLLKDSSEFGQYRVLRLLGQGGMGEVYEVEHKVLGTRHALKRLSDEVLDLEEVLDFFKNEGRVMAQLKHQGIVSVDEFGETNGSYWLRMELIEGVPTTSGIRLITLHDYVWHHGGRLREGEVVECMRQFLDAIGFAHDQGVVHRDLKPANILLDSEGMKISDFGLVKVAGEHWHKSRIAKSASSGLGDPSSGIDLEHSKPQVLGTFEYMSPEQKQGYTDNRSDLYAVGLIGFQLLTGKERPSVKPPSRIIEGIHPDWDAWFESALENDPEERFQSAKEMRDAIPDTSKTAPIGQLAPTGKFDKMHSKSMPPPRKTVAADLGIEEDNEDVEDVHLSRPGKRRRRKVESKPSRGTSGLLKWLIVLILLGCAAGGAYYYFGIISGGGTAKPVSVVDENPEHLTKPGSAPQKTEQEDPIVPSAILPDIPKVGHDWTVPSVGIRMKWKGAGAFRMGSSSSELGNEPKETPFRYVILSHGFWLASTEITVAQFRKFVESTGHQTGADGVRTVLSGRDWNPIPSANWESLSQGENDRPVVGVSWTDATIFCDWLTEAEKSIGQLPQDMKYVLPSEAQWEYACRGMSPWPHPFASGKELSQVISNFGAQRPNPSLAGSLVEGHGLYDMHGNVFEWCRGWYANDYKNLQMIDPEGPFNGQFRPMRGGGFRSPATECRAAYRRGAPSTHADDQTGFRIALAYQ